MSELLISIVIPALLDGASPIESAYLAAAELGRPDIAPALVAVCKRESKCQRVGVHEGDASRARKAWIYQSTVGHLDEACQPYERHAWGTRGAFGLSAASHHEYLPACYDPAILDIPLISARIAARKYLRRCDYYNVPLMPFTVSIPRVGEIGDPRRWKIYIGPASREWCPDGHRQTFDPVKYDWAVGEMAPARRAERKAWAREFERIDRESEAETMDDMRGLYGVGADK